MTGRSLKEVTAPEALWHLGSGNRAYSVRARPVQRKRFESGGLAAAEVDRWRSN